MSRFAQKFQHKFGFDGGLVARRLAAAGIDWSIEIAGGFLGSYFGVMVAALLVAMKNQPPEELQRSMWNGMGFGFVFWSLSIAFINRVLIQGLSRASLGKKLLKLELISSGLPLSWTTIITRWVLSYLSIAFGGLGYAYLFFNKEARAFHDVVANTDVIPLYAGVHMSVEYRETIQPQIPLSLHGMSPLMVFTSVHDERPSATVIRMPVRPIVGAGDERAPVSARVSGIDTVADLIELHPKKERFKKVA